MVGGPLAGALTRKVPVTVARPAVDACPHPDICACHHLRRRLWCSLGGRHHPHHLLGLLALFQQLLGQGLLLCCTHLQRAHRLFQALNPGLHEGFGLPWVALGHMCPLASALPHWSQNPCSLLEHRGIGIVPWRVWSTSVSYDLPYRVHGWHPPLHPYSLAPYMSCHSTSCTSPLLACTLGATLPCCALPCPPVLP